MAWGKQRVRGTLPAPVSESADSLAASMERATWGTMRMALGNTDEGRIHKLHTL